MESMKFTSLQEEVHFKMIKRLLFSSIVVTQFIAFSAVVRDDAFRGSDLNSGNGRGLLTAALSADEPFPCPECDPPNGPPSDPPLTLVSLLADEPFPCPECDPPNGPPLTLVLL